MTSTTTTMLNKQYFKNISLDQPFDSDDLFSSSLDLIDPNEYSGYSVSFDNIIKKENDESSSSPEIDQYLLQPSTTNNSPIEYNLSNLICSVCGAPAHGYNFDQLTCESCKAFFRRNALRHTEHLKCRGDGSCVIIRQTRRQCTYCRLKKCFDIQMRKDWIRTDEERELRQLQKLTKEQKKLNKLPSNRQPLLNLPIVVRKKKRLMIKAPEPSTQELVVRNVQPIFTQNIFGFHRYLCDEDQALLNNITNAYQSAAKQVDCSFINKYTSSALLSQFFNDESNTYQSLIYFYKQIPEFKQSDVADQVQLIKCNLNNIIHLYNIIIQQFQDNPNIGKHMSKWVNADFHFQMNRTRRYFYRFTEHPLILKLALVVLLFSINLSVPRSSQFLDYKNKRKLYESQDYYTTVLWRYLNHLFDEREAIRSMEIIVTQILRYQTLMHTMDRALRQSPDHHTLNALMLSILGFT